MGVRRFDQGHYHLLNKLDKIVTSCMLKAERILSTKRTMDPFTIKLHKEKNLRRYWRILLKKNRRITDYKALIKLNPGYSKDNIGTKRHEIMEHLCITGDAVKSLKEKG